VPGEQLQISCEVSAVPPPNVIHWYHDGKLLRDGHGYVVTEMPGQKYSRLSKLAKSSVSLMNSGEYKCRASNMAGSAEQTINVHVKGMY
jgi:hypothetical protein